MPTRDEYIDLITSEHIIRPRFVAAVDAEIGVLVGHQEVLRSFPTLYDVDNAVGDQLDTLGIWVGVSRRVDVLIPGKWFTWDDTAVTGWASGLWLASGASGGNVTVLPDDSYREAIRGKIAANKWDGTIDGAYNTMEAAFGMGGNVTIKDNQDMSQTVTVIGGTLQPTQIELIAGGLVPIKPCGVSQSVVVTDAAPLEGYLYRAGPFINGTTYFRFTALTKVFYMADTFADATVRVAPTIRSEFKFFKNGVYFASLVFEPGQTGATPSMATGGTLVQPGDLIEIDGPSPVNGVAQDLAISFLGYMA